ncbi:MULTISPECIES: LysM peptidoglycan-binding domain-containing protein [unclassified Vibrio]|uniref:LysM peptidoglycan-binding domain-containing protein n=1 Tax=unclassified Vibrio TaxID=2614977 RepID=UPI00296484DA|nr:MULTISPECIES: LysM peptidoglycan-binding domain-containing protein [unclassified Vibrio]MDW1583003.1 LysM peptidoglycan-binding domain-containing protein [Vibrio sp. Vb2897]MDW1641265.1 LysM peptidoglycan-binding domain-containing protein [Vibrio sp. Vb2896]
MSDNQKSKIEELVEQAEQPIAPKQEQPEVAPIPAQPEDQPLTFAEANGATFSDDMIEEFKDLPQFYKSALYLKEIQKPENEELYSKLIAKHVDKSLADEEDDFGNDKFVKSLVKYNIIEEDEEFASIRKEVDKNLAKIRDSHIKKNLESAGFTQDEIAQFDKESIESLKVQKLFFNEMVFEHNGKGMANIAQGRQFIDALKVNKDAIMGFLGNKNTQYAMNAMGLALAVSSGGTVPLIMQGIKFAGMAMQNETVKGIFKNFTDKVEGEFAKRGIDITPAKEIAEKAGGFLGGLKNSRFVKAAMVVGVVVGVGSVADLVTDGQVSDLVGQALDGPLDAVGLKDSFENALGGADGTPTDSAPTDGASANGVEVKADGAGDSVTTEVVTPQVTEHVVQSGDKAMTIAKQAYFDATGSYPTEQQIVAIVNDFGLNDPNKIMPGQVIEVPANFDKYALDSLGKVQADWLIEPQSAAASATAVADISAGGVTSIQSFYNIEMINQSYGSGQTIEAIQKMNEGLDITNLSPGDEVILGDMVYTVPDVSDAIINTTFGKYGAPDFIDTDAFVDMVKEANPDKDLSEGLFGFQTLGGNSDIGSLLAQDGLLEIPPVDYNALNPSVTETTISGVNHNNIRMHVLNAAYPDGVPELLDTNVFMDVVKDMNPELDRLQNKEYFSANVTFPTMDQIQAHINGFDSPNVEVYQQPPSEAVQINKGISAEDIKKKALEMASKANDKGYTI